MHVQQAVISNLNELTLTLQVASAFFPPRFSSHINIVRFIGFVSYKIIFMSYSYIYWPLLWDPQDR